MSYVARRKTNIPAAAGQSLDESVNMLLATRKLYVVGEKYAMAKHNENVTFTDYGIEEDDIESDEDQLQAELD